MAGKDGKGVGIGTWLFFFACVAVGLTIAFWPRG